MDGRMQVCRWKILFTNDINIHKSAQREYFIQGTAGKLTGLRT